MRLFALIIFVLGAVCGGAPAQASFYDMPAGTGAPGSIIAQEAMHGAPQGASATRVLYRSTGLHGETIAVSGVIIVPEGPPPSGGWPVIAWAHPTSGVVPHCAPSLAHFFFRQVQGLKEMLDEGYVVAATDYPGLGTPGPHPYLVGVSEARAVLDSVRAARALAATSNRFAVWGHSQGGQAALFTGLLAKGYAPDLQLVGVAAAAPATDLKMLLSDDIATAGGRNLTAMTFYSWSRVFDAPIDTIVDASAIPTMDALSNECIENIFDIIERHYTERPLAKAFLADASFATVEPWSSLLAQNTPGPLPSEIPIFLSQGTADGLVRPTSQRPISTVSVAAARPLHSTFCPVSHMPTRPRKVLRPRSPGSGIASTERRPPAIAHEPDNCWDNAAMESFFSSMKTERVARKVYRSRDEARADVFDYIERFYNSKRRHSTIGYISPMEFEMKVGLA